MRIFQFGDYLTYDISKDVMNLNKINAKNIKPRNTTGKKTE